MATLNKIWEDIQRTVSSRKLGKGLAVVVLLALLWFGFRSCSAYLNPPVTIYHIASDPIWYPLQLYGKESNLNAFSYELLFAIARNQNLKIELTPSPHLELIENLDSGKVDAVFTSMSPDLEAQENYLFSDPYYLFGAVLVVPINSKVTSLKDLTGKAIAVKRASTVLFHLPISKSSLIVPYDSPTIVLDKLARDEVDAVIMDQFTAYIYLSEFYRNKLKVASIPLTLEGLRLLTLKTPLGKALIDKFNAGLKNIRANGLYCILLDKWDLFDPENVDHAKTCSPTAHEKNLLD